MDGQSSRYQLRPSPGKWQGDEEQRNQVSGGGVKESGLREIILVFPHTSIPVGTYS